MDDKEKVSEEQNQSNRGRPKKTPDRDLISEKTERLNMSQQSKSQAPVTVNQIQENLKELYSSVLTGGKGSWVESLYDLNQWNPFIQNQRLKTINTLPGDLGREGLMKALKSPSTSEQGLRAQAWNLSVAQYLYYKILRLAADIPMFKYYKVPELLKKGDYEKKDFIAEDVFVDDWLKTFDLPNTLKRCSLDVKREGKATYVLRNSICVDKKGHKKTNYATWQKLPSNYVKLTGIGEHGYTASFNMMIFLSPGFSPKQYPDFIQKIWEDLVEKGIVSSGGKSNKYSFNADKAEKYSYDFQYENGGFETLKGSLELAKGVSKKSYAFWVPLPQDLCYTFCSDTSHAWAIPDTAGLFLGLQELADYDTLAGLVQSTPLTALLTAEVETIPNPNAGQDQTIINPETVMAFQDKFNMSSSTNLEAFFAPFKNFKLLSLPDVPNSSNITTNATKNFIDRAGMGGVFVATDKPSVSQTKGSQILEEAQCNFVTLQFESVLNMIINRLLGCEYEWKLNIWGNIFSFVDEVKRAKEAVLSGMTFMMPKLVSAEDLTMRDTKALENYIESLEIYEDLKTVTQATQILLQQGDTGRHVDGNDGDNRISNKVGRPSIDTNDIESDATAASVDSGTNTADARSYSYEPFDGKCKFCGQESDNVVCEECADKFEIDVD